jgi:glutamine synthetase
MEKFSYGVANRGCSVRIPTLTEKAGRGYYEDRRPAANIDPYLVTSSIFSVTCLDSYQLQEMKAHYEKFRTQRMKICSSFL